MVDVFDGCYDFFWGSRLKEFFLLENSCCVLFLVGYDCFFID